MNTLTSLEEYTKFINENASTLVYFSTPQCNVCKILKPKIMELINNDFNKIKMAYVNCEALKEVAAQNRIFTVPTILVFLDGKEFLRKSRNISIIEFKAELQRPYSMFFGD